MAFCEDCGKRATCKVMCDALELRLRQTCCAHQSVRAKPMDPALIRRMLADGRAIPYEGGHATGRIMAALPKLYKPQKV